MSPICLCVSVCLKAAAYQDLSREYGEDEQYSAENFRRISCSLSGTIISKGEEAPVSSHSFVSSIRVYLFRASSLLGENTVQVKEYGETEGFNMGHNRMYINSAKMKTWSLFYLRILSWILEKCLFLRAVLKECIIGFSSVRNIMGALREILEAKALERES